jgi:hypothetical protein
MVTMRHSRSTPAHWLKIVEACLSIYLLPTPNLRFNKSHPATGNGALGFIPAWRMR